MPGTSAGLLFAVKADLRRLLLRCRLIRFDGATDCDGAVRVYGTCRREGVPPRGMVDCIIATVARRTESTLSVADSHLEEVSRVIGIPMDATETD